MPIIPLSSWTGRKLIFEMFPLTFTEFLVFKQVERKTAATFAEKAFCKNRISFDRLLPYYKEYLEFGGFHFSFAKTRRKY